MKLHKAADELEVPVFHDTYSACRSAFLTAADELNAELRSYVHPSYTGVEGEELAVDVALVGSREAKRLLVFCSGIHGCEGYAGAAVQLDTMRNLRDAAPVSADGDELGYLFVHGLNPYGWSHGSRTNEHQVDLNRNFTNFPQSPTEHRLAHEIQQLNGLWTKQGPDWERITDRLNSLVARHGLPSVSDAVQCGQYFQDDGVGYGGAQPEWSNDTLHHIWAEFFDRQDVIGIVDWHTGIGTYGTPTLLCFDEQGSDAYAMAVDWWGAEAIDQTGAAYLSGSRPAYSGLHIVAAQHAARANGALAVGSVIEFGTFEQMEAVACLWVDRWLRNLPSDADPIKVAELAQRTKRFFYPNEEDWNQRVLTSGRSLVREAVEGILRAR